MRCIGTALFLATMVPVGQPPPRFGESIEVERVLVDARVLDERGQVLRGLTASDFRLRVDGRAVAIESVLWVGAGGDAPPDDGVVVTPAGQSEVDRLVVFLFQKDMERSRITGLLKMIPRALEFVDALTPGDRVAVLSFDSHLRLWSDFTSDLEAVRRIVRHSLLFEEGLAYEEGSPSLFAHIGRAEARGAATLEEALALTGRALEALPGPKTVVLVGWGLGRFHGGLGVRLEPSYEEARRALLNARAAVFALDVTQADYHSLEVGLQQVAEDTGGFYASTYLFPDQGLERLKRALEGYYVVSFEKPSGRRGRHKVQLDLVKRRGTVLARNAYEG